MTDMSQGAEELDGAAQPGHDEVSGSGQLGPRLDVGPKVPGHPLHLGQGGGGEPGEDDFTLGRVRFLIAVASFVSPVDRRPTVLMNLKKKNHSQSFGQDKLFSCSS